MAALKQASTSLFHVVDSGRRDGEMPFHKDTSFERDISRVEECLSDIREMTDRVEIAAAVSGAFFCFREISHSDQLSEQLTSQNRDRLVEASFTAQAGVELHFEGLESERLTGSLRALRVLVIHFAKPSNRRNMPADRLADLRALIWLGDKAAREIGILDDMALRAETRAISTLDFCEDWS
ncbi:MAG: hypothetical protein ACAH22_00055 [Tardiphaga sp.]